MSNFGKANNHLPAAGEPLLTVIIAVYNKEAYLRQCLDSVLGQSLREIAVILVNDASTDASAAICTEYAARDARIRIIHKPQNEGLSSARNTALAQVTTPWVTFVDADDAVAPDIYAEPLQKGIEQGCDIIEVPIRMHYGSPNEKCELPLYPASARGVDRLHHWVQSGNYMHAHVCNKIFKTKLFEHLRFAVGRAYEDVFLYPKLLLEADAVAAFHSGGYYYYDRAGSITHEHSLAKLTDLFDAYMELFRLTHRAHSAGVVHPLFYLSMVDTRIDVLRAARREGQTPPRLPADFAACRLGLITLLKLNIPLRRKLKNLTLVLPGVDKHVKMLAGMKATACSYL